MNIRSCRASRVGGHRRWVGHVSPADARRLLGYGGVFFAALPTERMEDCHSNGAGEWVLRARQLRQATGAWAVSTLMSPAHIACGGSG